jgi:5-methylcytosine-specific restriction endonuclease McrA
MKSTLLLNASYEPLSVVSARRAVALIIKEKAVSLDDSPAIFESAYASINIPYVARLNRFVKKSSSVRTPRFSRRGVLVRDNHTCAYCGKYADTIDHVLPRHAGGTSTYENCVASCLSCNGKKSNKLLHDIGWSLKFKPSAPTLSENLLGKAKAHEELFEYWSEYIYMYDPSLKKEPVK